METEALDFITTISAASVSIDRINRLLLALNDTNETTRWVHSSPPSSSPLLLPPLLVSIVNSSALNAKVRFAALACLVALSKVADQQYRRNSLFQHIVTLDTSFESLLLEREDAAKEFGTQLGRQHEHMILLLFRCGGYGAIKAVDLLYDFCSGNDVLLVQLLLSILKVRTHEWPLLRAAYRCLMELTFPATYFFNNDASSGAGGGHSPSTGDRTIHVSDFHSKIVTIIIHGMQGNWFKTLGDDLSDRWSALSSSPSADAALLSPLPALQGTGDRTDATTLLSWFAQALHALNTTLLNLDLYNEQIALQRNLQQSLMVQLGSAVASLWLGFPRWIVEHHPNLLLGGHANKDVLRAVVSSLQVARMALYKSARALQPHIATALGALTETCAMQIPHLKGAGGIAVLNHLLQLLVNVNALQRPETLAIATGSLSGACQTLLATIAADSSTRLAGGASLSQTLSTLYVSERSHYVASENDTSRSITNGLCGAALDELVDEIMDFIDSELSRLGLNSSSTAAANVSGILEREVQPQHSPLVPEVAPVPAPHAIEEWVELQDVGGAPASSSLPSTDVKKKKKKKSRSVHPAEYLCALSGKLMREPVLIRSTGHWFELEELERIMETVGHVDPISGESFEEDPEVDVRKQKEIQRYLVRYNSARKQEETE